MFGFDWSEIALIGVVALVLIGPKDMPVAIRTVTTGIKKMRGMAAEMQGHVEEMVREADLGEARDAFRDLRSMNLRSQVLKTIDGDGLLQRTLNEKPLMDANLFGPPTPKGLAVGSLDAASEPSANGITLPDSRNVRSSGGHRLRFGQLAVPDSDPDAPAWLPPGAPRARRPAAPAFIPPRPRPSPLRPMWS